MSLWLFDIVTTGKVHPQPQFFIVWLCFYHNFSMMGPTINCGTAAGYKKQQRATSCDGKMDEQWSMLYCSCLKINAIQCFCC
jgi:hypothetical protein